MPSLRDRVRPFLEFLRTWGIDLKTRHRRDAEDAIAVQRRILRARKVRVVLDCGAHHGRLSRLYKKSFPEAEVFAFEPTPETFKVLQANVAGVMGITAVNAAVGDVAGEIPFYLKEGDEQSNSLVPPVGTGGEGEKEREGGASVRVRVETIDGFCEAQGIERVDVLKLDVEGHELAALKGASRLLEAGAIDVIMAEFRIEDPRPGAVKFLELANHLAGLGYHLWGFYGLIWDENLRIDWGDAIWVSDPMFRELYPRGVGAAHT